MAKTKTKSKSKNKKTRKKQASYKREAYAFVSMLCFIIGMSRFGFIGAFIYNLYALLVGRLAITVLGLLILLTILMILFKQLPHFPRRWVIGLLVLLPMSALILHAIFYERQAAAGLNIVALTWRNGWANLTTPRLYEMGGGLLGAALYAVTYFTVSQIGTYILLSIAVVADLCYLLGISWQDLISGLQLFLASFNAWFKQLQDSYIQGRNEKFKAKQDKVIQEKIDLAYEHKKKAEVGEIEGINKTGVPSEDQEEVKQEPRKPVEIVGPMLSKLETKNEKLGRKPQVEPVPLDLKVDQTTDDDSHMADISLAYEEENPNYQLPPLDLLEHRKQTDQSGEYEIIQQNIDKLENTFASFNVDAKVVKANLGPAVTKYEIEPAIGTKVAKITNLADDIALALAAKDIRIEAPIPGRSVIGIEVPNQYVSLVSIRESIANAKEISKLLEVPLGRSITGQIQMADLTKMPHLLIAGSTGSGKSVCINTIIVNILMKAKPNEVKMMMIDPKKVELNVYNEIPHLLTPVVTNPRKAAQALNKVVIEMERRYELFASTGTRNMAGYNQHLKAMRQAMKQGDVTVEKMEPYLPYIVVVVDELADLMMVASKEVEAAITRLAQMARAAGIHMILATQRPSVDVITGIIKANVPSRIAFAVSSGTDSRTIIDQNGAEKLLGRGDMLYMPMGSGKPIRVQGAFITDEEVERVSQFVKAQQEAHYYEEMAPSELNEAGGDEEVDDLWDEVIAFVRTRENVSISMLQRRFRIGYNRAARLVDEMTLRGIVGEQEGSKPRKVNIYEGDSNENAPLP